MRLGKMPIVAAVITLLTLSLQAKEITSFAEITDLAESYTLAGDVTLPEDFSAIGSSDAPFTGTFDGAGFTVSGAVSSLFGCTDGAVIRNVSVADGTLKGTETVGGIVGNAMGETVIENCSVTASITADESLLRANIGGIVGLLGEKATVSDCTARLTGTIENAPFDLHIGGICAQNDGTIRACRAEGTLSVASGAYMACIGGIAADNRGSLEACVNFATLKAELKTDASYAFVGGICGYNDEGTVTRCINVGEIEANGSTFYPVYGGGICGVNRNGTVSVTKNLAGLTAVKSFAGGTVGLNFGYTGEATLADSLNTGELSVSDSVGGGIVGRNVTANDDSKSSVLRALNRTSNKGVGDNRATVSALYSIGEADGVSTAVTEETLKTDGVPTLSAENGAWISNSAIGALPDLIVVSDLAIPELVLSEYGENGTLAYCFYAPTDKTYAKSFIAVYYGGNRYLGSSYVEKTPNGAYTALAAKNIPEETDTVKFIAFSETFADGFAPASVESVEAAYQK